MRRMIVAAVLMAMGSVLALTAAAGPLEDFLVIQACFAGGIGIVALGAMLRRASGSLSESKDLEGAQHAAGTGARVRQMDMAAAALQGQKPVSIERLEEIGKAMQDIFEGRQALLDQMGIGRYAELMGALAAAERALQRSRSAASDGYPEEALASIEEFRARLAEAAAHASAGR